MLPYCVSTWSPGTLCRILATCYHLQWCVLRLEAPWVPVWGSRRHQFEMWWLKSVRTQSDTEERLYRDEVISLFLSLVSHRDASNFHLNISPFPLETKKPPVLIRAHVCERHFGTVRAHFQSEITGITGFVSAEEAGGMTRRWTSRSCVARVCFYWGSETARLYQTWSKQRRNQIRPQGCEASSDKKNQRMMSEIRRDDIREAVRTAPSTEPSHLHKGSRYR